MGARINEDFSKELLKERWDLIKEEYKELHDEWWPHEDNKRDKGRIAKELADLVYVVYGAAVNIGIDLDTAVEEVHNSNMSKLDDNGNPIYNSNGKVLKGPNYKPPNMERALLC